MDIKKWVPWNWFNKEEGNTGSTVPVRQKPEQRHYGSLTNPIQQFHDEIDRLFDHAFRGFGMMPRGVDRPFGENMMKPTLDLGATDKEYSIALEIPGIDEKDVKLEIVNDTLAIRGEKKMESEEKNKNYYRMERSYGSFQRLLSLPEDVDQDGVKASFNKGVLTVTLPRKALPDSGVKRIAVTGS